jgi:MFS family permease
MLVTLLQRRWLVIVSLAVSGFVISGLGSVAIGLFISPMMAEFGWPNGRTSAIAPAFTMASLLAAPGVGVALDRFGTRTVMALGVLAVSVGFLLASRCHNWYTMLAAFALAGIGYSASFYLPSAVVVATWMPNQRSLAIGIILGAASAGSALFSPLIGWLVEVRDWRVASEMIGVTTALTLPLILLTVRTGLKVDSQISDAAREKSNTRAVERHVLFSSTVFFSIASCAMFSVGMSGIYYHVVSVLVKAGYSGHLAGLVFGATWLLSAFGSLVLGVIADRLGAKKILAAALLAGAVGTLSLLGAEDRVLGTACVVAFVVLWGTTANGAFQMVPVILAERFGSQHLGTLIGVQSAIAGIAGAAAPVITGLLYDRSGDYHLAIYLSASATFIAFVLASLIKSPKQLKGLGQPHALPGVDA